MTRDPVLVTLAVWLVLGVAVGYLIGKEFRARGQ